MSKIFVAPSSFIVTNKGLFRAENLKPGMIVRSTDNKIQSIVEISKQEKIVKEVVFENNQVVFFDLKNNVVTFDSEKTGSGLLKDDYLKKTFFNYFSNIKDKKIEWNNRKSILNLKIPTHLNEDFSFWLGIICVQSKISVKGSCVDILIDNGHEDFFKNDFVELTRKIFQLTPKIFKDKVGNRYVQINSSNLVAFIFYYLGRKKKYKKIPSIILEASLAEQISFVKGMSSRSYQEKSKLYFYGGSSKFISDFLVNFLGSIGYSVSLKTKKTALDRFVYYVKINGKHKNAIDISNSFLNIKKLSNNVNVIIPIIDEEFKVSYSNKSYKSFKGILKDGKKICRGQILDNIGLNYDDGNYVLKIKSIKLVKKDMIEITLPKEEGLIIDGFFVK